MPGAYAPDELIVRFDRDASASSKIAANRKAGASSASKLGRTVPGLTKVRLKKGVSVQQALAAYRKQPGVRYAEPNYRLSASVMPDDPSLGLLWGLQNSGQSSGTVDADIDAPEAWEKTTGSAEVVVAVVDTGIDYAHPDLANNVWTNAGEIAGNGLDDDSNGYVDDVHGIDTANDDSDPLDDHGHGTHCAGTIGAEGDNAQGVVGANWRVKMMALKFLGSDGSGYTADAIPAIEYAHRMGADVLSNSWGGGGYSQAMYDTIRGVDSLFVFAAGNDSQNGDISPHYPSSYDLPNILSVGASTRDDEMAWFSNYGAESVDVFAPGQEILSTTLGGGYGTKSGTSMATPHVAGAACLLLSLSPTVSWDTLKLAVMGAAEHKAALDSFCVSGARINANLALDSVSAVPGVLTGTVTSGSGSPVAGAVVKVDRILQTITDGSGEYSISGIPPGAHTLACGHPDYLDAVVRGVVIDAAGTTTHDMRLQTAGHITGAVTAASDGAGLGDIEVTVYQRREDDGEIWWEPRRDALTATDGTYDVGGLATGTYRVGFYDPSDGYLREYYNNATAVESAFDVAVTAGTTTPGIDAALVAPGRIAGTVTAGWGGALGDIEVTIYRLYQDGTDSWWVPVDGGYTESDGTYDVGGMATGTYRVGFHDPADDYADEYYDDANSLGTASDITVTAGATTPGVDAVLATAGRIAGTVTAASGGAALGDIEVTVHRLHEDGAESWWDLVRDTYTEADGTYEVGGLSTGTYRVGFYDPSDGYLREYYHDATAIESASDVAVTAGVTTPGIDAALFTAGRISGTVTAASNGVALGDIKVTVHQRQEDGATSWWKPYREAYTAADGTYDVGGLATGCYRVGYYDPSDGYADKYYDNAASLGEATDVAVTAGVTTLGIDAALAGLTPPANDDFSDAEEITGVVGHLAASNRGGTTEPGEPRPEHGASIWYTWQAPATGPWIVDTAGSSFDTLLAVYQGDSIGALEEVAFDDDSGIGLTSRVEVDVSQGQTYRIVVKGYESSSGRVALNWTQAAVLGSLTGIVTAPGGAPVVGVSVSVAGKAADTAIDGTYTVPELVPGVYDVTFAKAGYTTQTASVTVVAGVATMKNVELAVADTTLLAGFGSATDTRSEVTVGYGKGATLVGKLNDAAGDGLSGKTVIAERYDTALKRWVTLGQASAGATAGEYRYTVKPHLGTLTSFRMSFVQDDYNTASQSAPRALRPNTWVSAPVAPSRMSRTKYYTVYGYLKPKHASVVRIYKWRKTSTGKWRSYGYVTAKTSALSDKTKYSVRLKLGRAGTWKLRAYTPKDVGHAATWSSGSDYVKVR